MPKTKCVIDRIKEADKKLIEKFGADAFDDFDCRPGNSYPEADRDDVIPVDIKREIAERPDSFDDYDNRDRTPEQIKRSAEYANKLTAMNKKNGNQQDAADDAAGQK